MTSWEWPRCTVNVLCSLFSAPTFLLLAWMKGQMWKAEPKQANGKPKICPQNTISETLRMFWHFLNGAFMDQTAFRGINILVITGDELSPSFELRSVNWLECVNFAQSLSETKIVPSTRMCSLWVTVIGSTVECRGIFITIALWIFASGMQLRACEASTGLTLLSFHGMYPGRHLIKRLVPQHIKRSLL